MQDSEPFFDKSHFREYDQALEFARCTKPELGPSVVRKQRKAGNFLCNEVAQLFG